MPTKAKPEVEWLNRSSSCSVCTVTQPPMDRPCPGFIFSSPTPSSFATKCQETSAVCIKCSSLPIWCVFTAISLQRSLIGLSVNSLTVSSSCLDLEGVRPKFFTQLTKKASANAADLSSQNLLEEYKQQLEKAIEKIAYLESELESKCLYCSQLVSSLEKVQDTADELSSESHQVKLQVEHRAQQQGQARKGVLLEQIRLLKSANRKKSEDYESSSSKAIDSLHRLEKDNFKHQSELSKGLGRSQAGCKCFQDKMLSLGNRLKESEHLASNFKKQCD